MSYPLFYPPDFVTVARFQEMPKRMAEAYFNWFVVVKESRIRDCLALLGQTGDNVRLDLAAIKLSALVRTQHVIADPEMNLVGFSIALDAGLLVCRKLEEEFGPRLYWDWIRKPKSDASFHQPALRGFVGECALNPFQIGRTFVFKTLDNLDVGNALVATHQAWRESLPQ